MKISLKKTLGFCAAALLAGAIYLPNAGKTVNSSDLGSFTKIADANAEGILFGCPKIGGKCNVRTASGGSGVITGVQP
ncbi:hypothetical protein PQ465_04830 [Sphingobacterium oryzagri]|uniref:Secreted protein n=1 Tax=Sphingobacterium oryzagri TaxID=3025669 RepID=A0ABY7WJF9_9SPHI|nr:hypothetical protein [Sphingobacterium sp. KACC 22765]WDF69707.1 hypothetical protein PQ465_04830 [Sphingobacterium sp. KACC 22765]